MYKLIKRIIDFVASVAGLILLSPLFLIVMLLLKLSKEGEMFYLQERVGYKTNPFKIWKFATMVKNSPNMLTGSLTMRNDPRVTPVGRYLRKSKLNELPQLINVVIGNMSLVGPRPQMEVDFLAYPQDIQNKIYNVKPGITSLGSIIYRDEESLISEAEDVHLFYKEKIAPHKGAVEIWYQQNSGILKDLFIIFLTLWVVVFPQSDLINKVFKGLPKRNF